MPQLLLCTLHTQFIPANVSRGQGKGPHTASTGWNLAPTARYDPAHWGTTSGASSRQRCSDRWCPRCTLTRYPVYSCLHPSLQLRLAGIISAVDLSGTRQTTHGASLLWRFLPPLLTFENGVDSLPIAKLIFRSVDVRELHGWASPLDDLSPTPVHLGKQRGSLTHRLYDCSDCLQCNLKSRLHAVYHGVTQ